MKLTSLLSDPSIDPCVALLIATDLSLDEVLMVRVGDYHRPAILMLPPGPAGRRVVLLSHPARAVLAPLVDQVVDPQARLFPELSGRLPTRSVLLRVVSDHLDYLQNYRACPVVVAAKRRLAGLLCEALRAA